MKNISKIMMFSFLAVVLVAGTFTVADAIPTGKDIIIYPTEKVLSPDRIRMNEIVALLENESTLESEKQDLYSEAQEIRHRAITSYTVDINGITEAKSAKGIMADIMNDEIVIDEIGNIREIVTGVGRGKGDVFTIYVNPTFFDDETLKKFSNQIRTHVGTDIDITFKSMEQPVKATCTSQTGTCDPPEGGVKVEAKNHNACSIGFQADDGGAEGFIMAGHCADAGSGTSDDVFQPYEDWFGWNKIGNVNDNVYVDETTFDGAFVAIDVSSVSDKIYSNILPDVVGSIVYDDYMTTKGYSSSSFTGQIDDVDIDISYDAGIDVRGQFRVDTTAIPGDSGGPTYESGAQYPDLMGIVVAKDNGNTVSFHSAAANMTAEFSGVSWDFS
jgi:hypothetical protein